MLYYIWVIISHMRGSGDLSNKVAATSDLFSYEAKDPVEVNSLSLLQYYNNYA